MEMLAQNPLEFPTSIPDGFPPIEDEPVFDPARHLALEEPETIVLLTDLGYSKEVVEGCPSPLALTSSFRLLSPEGADCLLGVARKLKRHARSIERISRMVRGGVYQSRFLRDLCLCPQVTELVSEICVAPVAPHTMPHQLGHLNYNPDTVGENIDKWHSDTLRIDYVLFVTDPNTFDGGEFQTFRGTKDEVSELKRLGRPLPEDRIDSWKAPGPGYASLLQGNMVVHRAKALKSPGERITMVNGYVPRDLRYPDFTRFDQLYLADPAHVAVTEYERQTAWLAREHLQHLIDHPVYSKDRLRSVERLEHAARLLQTAANEIKQAGAATMEHFGDD
jgi:hypothetical protein